jgi:hypothetical protein
MSISAHYAETHGFDDERFKARLVVVPVGEGNDNAPREQRALREWMPVTALEKYCKRLWGLRGAGGMVTMAHTTVHISFC